MNEGQESGLPYDIVVRPAAGLAGQQEVGGLQVVAASCVLHGSMDACDMLTCPLFDDVMQCTC